MGKAQKLDETAGGLPVADEVEVSTETNAENPDNDDDEGEEDDEEVDKEADKEADEEADEEVEDPEWHEETAVQVFVDRDLRARLSRSTLAVFYQARPEL